MTFPLHELFDDLPAIDVVDVGASPIDGSPPYQPLVEQGKARVIGFEPNLEQYQLLQEQQTPYLTFLPYVIGDGQDGTLNLCSAPGMTSLLEPDQELLGYFHGFSEWGRVIQREPVSTRRLDEVTEIGAIDYLKLDVQGGELAILQGATRRLQEILVIHTEVQFVPFYQNQPLFAELDQALRAAGFYLHCINPQVCRTFKPLVVNNDFYAGLNQLLWGDAVYVKKFTDFGQLSQSQLLKVALITHELYGSYDLCALALEFVDRQEGGDRQVQYIQALSA